MYSPKEKVFTIFGAYFLGGKVCPKKALFSGRKSVLSKKKTDLHH